MAFGKTSKGDSAMNKKRPEVIIRMDTTGFKQRLWERAFSKNLMKKKIDKQFVFYGIKRFGFRREKSDRSKNLQAKFLMMDTITSAIERFTPREFMQIFPIKKDFEGHKYECKDYFSTMEHIEKIGIDNLIPNGFEFLLEYWNDDTHRFLMNMLNVMDDIRYQQGKVSMLEEFLSNEGFEL